MLRILGNPRRACDGLTRRELLRAGGAGLLGLGLPKLLAAEAARPRRPDRARSVIFLFLFGGPSQLESFDLKPDAPSGIRGPFRPTASRTPGLLISEHLQRLARISDRFCVVRTLTHPANDHSTGAHYIQTGRPWHIPIGGGFNATPRDWPAMGSVAEYVAQRSPGGVAREVPGYFYLPNHLGHLETYSVRLDRPGQYAGWLGAACNPLATNIQKRDARDNPYFRPCTDEELDFRIPDMTLGDGLTLDALDRRRSLLDQLDAGRRRLEAAPGVRSLGQLHARALRLLASERLRAALDVRREPPRLRDRYGRHLFGQATLLARRLVEAGARFVTVGWDTVDGYSWDSHVHSNDVRQYLQPGLDQALSALLEDLDERGLLAETLVLCLGEMGRTPRLSGDGGRGHWSMLFPALLAGAGVRGGTVYGRSDRDAAWPLERPVSPEDLAATVYHALGIDPHMTLTDPQGRPVPLLDGGAPLTSLFG
jgi:hypothetical protein